MACCFLWGRSCRWSGWSSIHRQGGCRRIEDEVLSDFPKISGQEDVITKKSKDQYAATQH
uniref:Uncharacterized protein n=1 Tax=Arundo donax TaxID=35708 RepID=A0A0A9EET0_ARUDO